MPVRLKKFIGTLILIVLVIVYALLATAIASLYLGEAHWIIHLLYFTGTGVLWVIPAMFIIRWMELPPRRR
ncbi:DUF2842 domain-containing protein [Consotaella aegiceratis]|uniref:DUF2842 domain-containing protein n=1 Tax=Consotaella aegiceratis TaxID=3097961 RepID=UPI002F424639